MQAACLLLFYFCVWQAIIYCFTSSVHTILNILHERQAYMHVTLGMYRVSNSKVGSEGGGICFTLGSLLVDIEYNKPDTVMRDAMYM